MKEDEYRDIICKRFCSYYKPLKRDFSCGAFEFLKGSLTPEEIKALIEARVFTGLIEEKDLCQICSFRFGDCDFYEGLSDTPCGGYNLVMLLKKRWQGMDKKFKAGKKRTGDG